MTGTTGQWPPVSGWPSGLGWNCVLLGATGTNDAVDASVVVCATGDRVVTGDGGDIRPLVAASGRSILVVAC